MEVLRKDGVVSLDSEVNNILNIIDEELDPINQIKRRVLVKDGELFIDTQVFPISTKIHLFGVGKSSPYEVKAFIELLSEHGQDGYIEQAVCLTKLGHSICDNRIEQIEGSHPKISSTTIDNSNKFINKLRGVQEGDLLVFFLSGGASALLEIPHEKISFLELERKYQDFSLSDKSITEINKERRKYSTIKNGGLRSYIQTKNFIQFINNDIPSLHIYDVGSGPLLKLGESYDDTFILNDADNLLKRIKEKINCPYYHIYDEPLSGALDKIVKNLPSENEFFLSGGELSVDVTKLGGIGGRNTHFVLSLALEIFKNSNNQNIKILSYATDGDDGNSKCAGAYIDYSTFIENKSLAIECLNNYDSHSFFKSVGGLIKGRPKYSNLMDVRVIWNSSKV